MEELSNCKARIQLKGLFVPWCGSLVITPLTKKVSFVHGPRLNFGFRGVSMLGQQTWEPLQHADSAPLGWI